MHHIIRGLATALFAGSIVLAPLAQAAESPDYDAIITKVEQLRGLTLSHDLDITIMDRNDLQQAMEQQIDDAFTPDEQADSERMLSFIGFIEPGTDLKQLELDLMGEQVAGYYDSQTGQMVVVSTGNGELSALDEVTFAHETDHALQDEAFDLNALTTNQNMNADQQQAILSLVEGDATFLQSQYIIDKPSLISGIQAEAASIDSSVLDSAPLYRQISLLSPYDDGMQFVMALHDTGGYDAVNAAFTSNLPLSTEQILHPEKYQAGEAPIPVHISDPTAQLGAGWRVLDHDVFGELYTDIFIQNGGMPARDAAQASAGWGGDEYMFVGSDTETAFLWSTTWDTEQDAKEFMAAMLTVESSRLNATPSSITGNTHMRLIGDGTVADIMLDGKNVRYILAENDATLDTIAAAQSGPDTPLPTSDASPAASPVATPVRRLAGL